VKCPNITCECGGKAEWSIIKEVKCSRCHQLISIIILPRQEVEAWKNMAEAGLCTICTELGESIEKVLEQKK